MDEAQPLLYNENVFGQSLAITEQPLVDFDPEGDPDNPLTWSKSYKRGIVALLAFMAFTV